MTYSGKIVISIITDIIINWTTESKNNRQNTDPPPPPPPPQCCDCEYAYCCHFLHRLFIIIHSSTFQCFHLFCLTLLAKLQLYYFLLVFICCGHTDMALQQTHITVFDSSRRFCFRKLWCLFGQIGVLFFIIPVYHCMT